MQAEHAVSLPDMPFAAMLIDQTGRIPHLLQIVDIMKHHKKHANGIHAL